MAVIRDALATMPGVEGRMEILDLEAPFDVIIDYAHSPDSLEKLLQSVRKIFTGRIVLVFGCNGAQVKRSRYGLMVAAKTTRKPWRLSSERGRRIAESERKRRNRRRIKRVHCYATHALLTSTTITSPANASTPCVCLRHCVRGL